MTNSCGFPELTISIDAMPFYGRPALMEMLLMLLTIHRWRHSNRQRMLTLSKRRPILKMFFPRNLSEIHVIHLHHRLPAISRVQHLL